jgi:hypothetical protein
MKFFLFGSVDAAVLGLDLGNGCSCDGPRPPAFSTA